MELLCKCIKQSLKLKLSDVCVKIVSSLMNSVQRLHLVQLSKKLQEYLTVLNLTCAIVLLLLFPPMIL